MNKTISIIAVVCLLLILIKGLATAWLGMKLLPFVIVLLSFLIIGFFWGKMTK